MRKLILLLTVIICSLQLRAQIAVVNYMKVKPGGDDAFLANERTWKKLHQQRVNDGKMIGWEVYSIHGQGTGSQYNYATVDIYENRKAAMQDLTQDELKKAFGEKYADVQSKTNSTRDLVYSDTFSGRMYVGNKEPSKYTQVTYMRSKADNYYDMEEKAYKPIFQAAIDMGNLDSWGVWSRVYWNSMFYDAVVVQGFSSIDQMMKMNFDDTFQKATASMKPGELMEIVNLMDDTDDIRDMVRSQLWELVEKTTPKK